MTRDESDDVVALYRLAYYVVHIVYHTYVRVYLRTNCDYRDESDDVVEVCPETPKDVPDKSSDVKGNHILQLIQKAILL